MVGVVVGEEVFPVDHLTRLTLFIQESLINRKLFNQLLNIPLSLSLSHPPHQHIPQIIPIPHHLPRHTPSHKLSHFNYMPHFLKIRSVKVRLQLFENLSMTVFILQPALIVIGEVVEQEFLIASRGEKTCDSTVREISDVLVVDGGEEVEAGGRCHGA